MFIVSQKNLSLSPQAMSFWKFWIYDLRPLHPKLREKLIENSELPSASTPWQALLKALDLHLFSDLSETRELAFHYIRHFYPQTSERRLNESYRIFARLGLKKIGHLQRFSYTELHKRLTKGLAEFFSALVRPQEAHWPWQNYREKQVLYWSYDFEHSHLTAETLLGAIQEGLNKLTKDYPSLQFRNLFLKLIANEGEADIQLPFYFAQNYHLTNDLAWLLRLIRERLMATVLHAPIFKMNLEIHPEQAQENFQLSLFQKENTRSNWKRACQKLADFQFKVFRPESLPSYLPEESWRLSSPLNKSELLDHGLFRPLIQEKPRSINQPEGALWFTEKLRWYDKLGAAHSRHYFVTRMQGAWAWVFQNEKGEWFKQGLVE